MMTDQQHADKVREAVNALNAACINAAKAGLTVNLTISEWAHVDYKRMAVDAVISRPL